MDERFRIVDARVGICRLLLVAAWNDATGAANNAQRTISHGAAILPWHLIELDDDDDGLKDSIVDIFRRSEAACFCLLV